MGVENIFLKKLFLGDKLFWADLWGAAVLHVVTNDQIMPRGKESFKNTFYSNLNTVNLMIFLVGYTLEDKAVTNLKNYGGFILEVNS